ncbi:DUF2752 domain-containing protein [Paenibacillus psychroresistens]|uniref:DUF2752 domain-containing protein n=1 Tax=Paenibacillus psychroresistens TaxID=1778678 RepID=UPI001D042820|nr:DUF2752 domain-containing protein [Paenibacillus psychroresistens]
MWGTSLTAGGVLYLKVLAPVFNLSIPCPFHALTGLYCPGCGITRVITSLMDFNLAQAFRFNSLLFLLLPIYVLYSVLRLKGYKKFSDYVMFVMLVLTVSFGILRNIPMFSWLAPVQL